MSAQQSKIVISASDSLSAENMARCAGYEFMILKILRKTEHGPYNLFAGTDFPVKEVRDALSTKGYFVAPVGEEKAENVEFANGVDLRIDKLLQVSSDTWLLYWTVADLGVARCQGNVIITLEGLRARIVYWQITSIS